MKKYIKETMKFILLTLLWIVLGMVPIYVSICLFIKTDNMLWFLIFLSYVLILPIMNLIFEKSLKYLVGDEN